ncbi:unnamed protein product, partial [Prunus brigantina]
IVGSKCTRSKTATTTQSATNLSFHDVAAKTVAQHPGTVFATTTPAASAVPPFDLASESRNQTCVARKHLPVVRLCYWNYHQAAESNHYLYGFMATFEEHHLGATTNASQGPILEQVQPFHNLTPRSTYAPVYTSNETPARVQLSSTQFSPFDPRRSASQSPL